MSADPLADVLAGLKREKDEIRLVDEMARRAGIGEERGRFILAAARARGLSIKDVAWAIHDDARKGSGA